MNLTFCSVNYQSQCMVNQTYGVLNRVNRQGDVGWTNSLDNKSGVLIPYPFSMNPILCSGQHVHYFTSRQKGEGFVGPLATQVITAFCCPTHRHNCRQHFCLPPVFS